MVKKTAKKQTLAYWEPMTDQKITLAFDPDQFALIVDGLPNPTMVVDNLNGDILYLNESARTYFSIAPGDDSPRKGRDFVGDLERFKAYLSLLEKNGEVRGFELSTKKLMAIVSLRWFPGGQFFTASTPQP